MPVEHKPSSFINKFYSIVTVHIELIKTKKYEDIVKFDP